MSEYKFLYDPNYKTVPSIHTEDDNIFEEAKDEDRDSYDVEVVSNSQSSDEVEQTVNNSKTHFVDEEPNQEVDKNCKWQLFAEKASLRLFMKSLLSQTMTLCETLDLLGHHSRSTLTNPHAYPSLPALQRQTKFKLEKLNQKSNFQLQQELSLELNANKIKFSDFLELNQKVAQALAKERDRNLFLQNELQRQEQQFNQLQKSRSGTIEEDYVAEVEQQLNQLRQELVDTKLSMSDLQVENQELRQQYSQQEQQLEHAMSRALNLEQQFEELHHQISQLHQEKLTLQESLSTIQRPPLQPVRSSRQNMSVDFTKQYDQMRSQKESLEHLEAELLLKLDKKEAENYQLKRHIAQQEDQLEERIEGLQKAQKIIQRFNEKAEQDDLLIQRLSQDCQQLKNDNEQKQIKVNDLQKCFDDLNTRSRSEHDELHHKMSLEFSELKTAMSQYQQESDNQKQQFIHQLSQQTQKIKSLTAQLDESQNMLEETRDQSEADLQSKCLQIVELEDAISILKRDYDSTKHELQCEIQRQKEISQQQVTYLQTRVKDMVHETTQLNKGNQISLYNQSSPLVQQMRDELQKVCQEVLAVRETLRKCRLPRHIDECEEHQQSIASNLTQWEQKCVALIKLASKHSQQLDMIQSQFCQMKVLVKEKDQLITDLQQAIQEREELHLHEVYGLRVELTQTHRIVYQDMLSTIALQSQLLEQKEQEKQREKDLADEYKQIYLRLIDEKDVIQTQLNERHKELSKLTDQHCQLQQICKKMIGDDTGNFNELSDFEAFLTNFTSVAESKRVLLEDVANLQNCVEQQKDLRRRDAEDFESRLEKCEQELKDLAEECRFKEEQLLFNFTQKEEQLMLQVHEARENEEKMCQQLQVRERQFQKMNERISEYQEDLNNLNSKILESEREKEQMTARYEKIERENILNETQLAQTKETFNLQHIREDELHREKLRLQSVLADKEEANQKLTAELKETESQLKRTQLEFDLHQKQQVSTDLKLKDIQLDYQNLYNEMRQYQEQNNKLKTDKEKLKRDVDQLISDLANREVQIMKHGQEMKLHLDKIDELKKTTTDTKGREVALDTLKALLRERDQQVHELQSKINSGKAECKTISCQTMFDSSQQYKIELQRAIQAHDMMAFEATHLREALNRLTIEQHRLIEDKREFEEIIEHQNTQLSSYKQQNLLSGRNRNPCQTSDMLEQIIREKDSYINKLELEISEMKKDSDNQKLMNELNTIGGDSTTRVSNYGTLIGGPSREGHYRDRSFNRNTQEQRFESLTQRYHAGPYNHF